MESTHCFMLLHHMHSELVLVHSLQVALKAQGVRQGLALWLAAQGKAFTTSNPASKPGGAKQEDAATHLAVRTDSR